MKKVIFFKVLFLSLNFAGIAQKVDSVINYQTFSIELKTSSKKINNDCYYETITQKLKVGDRVFLSYNSTKFATRMYIKSPSGQSDTVSDCQNAFPKSVSYSEFCFQANENGNYDFYLSSIIPHSIGLGYLMFSSVDSKFYKMSPLWNTCEKLNYILNLSHTNFQFINIDINPHDNNIGYTPNCKLFNESPGMIFGLSNNNGQRVYNTVYANVITLATAKVMMQNVENQLSKCFGPDWTIEEATSEGDLREIDYIQKGNYENEFNEVHKQNNFKNKISIKTEKQGTSYLVIFRIY